MNEQFRNFELTSALHILLSLLEHPPLSIGFPPPTAMENPVDRTIRLMALAAGLVGLLVIVVFQFL